jgi:thymidylate synthase (FAD)
MQLELDQQSNVKLVSVTQPLVKNIGTPEELIVYCARVSNPSNQFNKETSGKLLNYCIDHGHWSPFEMASMTVEITTSRAIAAQILRHRSFSFQEFSQRYAGVTGTQELNWRAQGKTNRQVGDEEIELSDQLKEKIYLSQRLSLDVYQNLIEEGVARECARMILPLNTTTTLYMSGTVRSWIHYLDLRLDEVTQAEHRIIAQKIKDIFIGEFPIISNALNFQCIDCSSVNLNELHEQIISNSYVADQMWSTNCTDFKITELKRHSLDEYYFEIKGEPINDLTDLGSTIAGVIKIIDGEYKVDYCEVNKIGEYKRLAYENY